MRLQALIALYSSKRPSRLLYNMIFTALLLATGLTSCAKLTPPAKSNSSALLPPGSLVKVGTRAEPVPGTRIVLPDSKLIGCKADSCPPVLQENSTQPTSVYPWQVALDYNRGSVIGLTAVYDQPTTVDDVAAAVNERYGKWARTDFKGPLRLWRVEPERFVISLTVNGNGMVQLIYLTFDPRHPVSAQVAEKVLASCSEEHSSANCGLLLIGH